LAPVVVVVAETVALGLMEAIQSLAQLLLRVAAVEVQQVQGLVVLVALVAAGEVVVLVALVIPQAQAQVKEIMAEQVLTIVLLAEVVQVLLDQIQLPMPDQTVVLVQRHQLLALR
jgi:hypothetical protein